MIKTTFLAVLIFIGMILYNGTDTKETPVQNSPSQERRLAVHERSAAKSLLLKLLPPKDEWPGYVQKFYLVFNLDEEIDPLRQKPDWTELSNMSGNMPQALIAIEDHDFYKHGPIDINGVARAILVNTTAGEIVQGGSTLTQQLVKNIFLNDEQSLERKTAEFILAAAMEHKYSKDEILALYLNTTYFGAGATGVHQASQRYFAKAPSALTLAECAVIAALPYAPSALNPLENPAGCKKRQLLVLDAMQKYGFITQAQQQEAAETKLPLSNGEYL